MTGDLPSILSGLVPLWAASVLYGINVVMFILCVVVLSRKRDRGDPVPRFLLFTICLQFALCSAHIGVAFGAGIHAFLAPIQNSVTLTVTKWDSPLGIFTALQQQFYGWNNLIGDLVLIWRLYVVYGNNWQITILPLLLAFAAEGCTQYGGLVTFINPAKIIAQQKATKAGKTSVVSQVVTAGFSLTAATQLLVTLLLAFKIYTATRSIGQLSDRKASRYSSLIWTLVESGAAMAAGEIIFVAVWQTAHGAAAQLVLAILGQLCALVPFSIFVRIGLRLAFEGKHATYYASSNSVPASGTLQSIQFARSPHTQDESTGQLSEFKERSWGSQNQEV